MMRMSEFFDNPVPISLHLAGAHVPTLNFSADGAGESVAIASSSGRFAPWRVIIDGYVVEWSWGDASCWDFLDQAESGEECVEIMRNIFVDIALIESGCFSARLMRPLWGVQCLDVTTVGGLRHFRKAKGAEWPVDSWGG